MLAIVKYIKKNGLDNAIKNFKLKAKFYENKVLLKYNQIESDISIKEVQECRGLILDKFDLTVMSLAFFKFFNAEESNAVKIDWNTANVLEKLDGSSIQVYFDKYENAWFGGTTGTAEGESEVNNKFGTTFNNLFWDTVKKYNLNVELMNKRCCFVFELTTPYNIVVKPHNESSATLLTIRNLDTLEELSREEVVRYAALLNVPVVKSFDLNDKNINALIQKFEGMPWSEEGYVVVDANFNRIKIKNPAYVAVHHLKGKTAEYNIFTIIKANEIEEFSATFIERKEEIFLLKEKYDELILRLENIWSELLEFLPKNSLREETKNYAIKVFEITKKNNLENFTGLFFSLKDNKVLSVKDFIFNYDNKSLYKFINDRIQKL